MVNSDNGIRLASAIARSVSAACGWKDLKPVEKTGVPTSAAELAEYAGEYDSRGTMVEVRVAGDHLLIRRKGWVPSAVEPEAADQLFVSDDDGPKVAFQRANGAVTGMKIDGTGVKKALH